MVIYIKHYFAHHMSYDIVGKISVTNSKMIVYCKMQNVFIETRIRDIVRKVAFGMNFAIIGLENQENMDYSIPIRTMNYDISAYEKQLSKMRKELRKTAANLTAGEYLYGFRKDSKLHPVMTLILYSGSQTWDGPLSLHDILNFESIPPELQDMVSDYIMNIIDIRRLKDTSIFKTDVRQVFEFIKCANDKNALKSLVEKDEYYKNMDEEAFDVAVQYTNAKELIEAKEYYEKDGGVNMCQALKELIEEGREEGKQETLLGQIQKKLAKGQSVEQIADALEESTETIEKLIKEHFNN